MIHVWRRDNFLISTDPALLNLEKIQELLSTSYWDPNRPIALTRRAIEHSLVFGVYNGERQIGFARLVTDYTFFGYLCDVMIDDEYRGQGLGKWLIASILSHPELQGVRRWLLITRDAHGLYQQFGFTGLDEPERYMQLMRTAAPANGLVLPPTSIPEE
ncbi:MAG: GNAT family N-acetyltransferase [Chloroflexi bacterium]|nr:GNAT family N-acetyltransferase [Chloroflexota bacterium]